MSGLRHLTPTSNTIHLTELLSWPSFSPALILIPKFTTVPRHSCSLHPYGDLDRYQDWKCFSLAKEFILGKLSHYSPPHNWLGTSFDRICYICLLFATSLLSSHISNFVLSKQKLVILTDLQHQNLTTTCWYFFINTVTEHQKSVHGCFPLLDSNLDVWDGNRCFTNELLKCFVPRATKEFSWSYMYKSIHKCLEYVSSETNNTHV